MKVTEVTNTAEPKPKKRSNSKPGHRTKQALEKQGYMAAVVEKRVPGNKVNISQDLYGFVDVLAIHPKMGTLAIQCTSGANTAARIKKILEERAEEAKIALQANWRIQVWGWRKLKVKRGGKAVRWQPAITEITLKDFQ